MKPMTREEAILQMNLLEHSFFAFRDEENDEAGDLLKLELMAPNQKQAYRLANAFTKNAERIYSGIMDELLIDPEEGT